MTTFTEAQIQKFIDATNILDRVANGTYAEVVVTEQGDLITVNKAITDMATFTPQGAWVTSTAYVEKDLVTEGGFTYAVVEDHTSGVFATDITNGLLAAYYNIDNVTASAISAAEAAASVLSLVGEAWITMTLINGWTATRARYRLTDAESRVEIDIYQLDDSASTSPEIFLLPSGYIPAHNFTYSFKTNVLYITDAYPDYVAAIFPDGVASFQVQFPIN